MRALDQETIAPESITGPRPASVAPSFPKWMDATEDAERLIRAFAPEGEIYEAMHRARGLEARAVIEIRQAASAGVEAVGPHLFRFAGRIYLVMPDGAELDIEDQLSTQILAIDDGCQVIGDPPPPRRPRAGGQRRHS